MLGLLGVAVRLLLSCPLRLDFFETVQHFARLRSDALVVSHHLVDRLFRDVALQCGAVHAHERGLHGARQVARGDPERVVTDGVGFQVSDPPVVPIEFDHIDVPLLAVGIGQHDAVPVVVDLPAVHAGFVERLVGLQPFCVVALEGGLLRLRQLARLLDRQSLGLEEPRLRRLRVSDNTD